MKLRNGNTSECHLCVVSGPDIFSDCTEDEEPFFDIQILEYICYGKGRHSVNVDIFHGFWASVYFRMDQSTPNVAYIQ